MAEYRHVQIAQGHAVTVRLARQQTAGAGFITVTKSQGRIYLDELDPERGDIRAERDFECSLVCVGAEAA